ncbi:MAG TPA: phospho-N-acetylmuramoyl-pentapeptide-transferase [Pirellulales bacterium]
MAPYSSFDNPSIMVVWLYDFFCAHSVAAGEGSRGLMLRALLAGLGLLLAALAAGTPTINWLRSRFIEPIKSASHKLDELHRAKQSTPTMGGLFLIAGVVIAVLALADAQNRYVLLGLAVTLGLAMLGAIDDLIKLRTTSAGLGWRAKLSGQLAVALPAAICLAKWRSESSLWLAIPWLTLVIVGSSNAVNITDGLDGLAAGCLLLATLATSCAIFAQADPANAELIVVAAATIGGLLGFLWFNRHPARVFMGNVGSLPLGGLLGVLAAATGQELLLIVSGGVFVAEAASVLLQIGAFRWFHKRIFRCAPLHHHFEFLGWTERRVVARFWGAAALCAVCAVAIVSFGSRHRVAQSGDAQVVARSERAIEVHVAKPVLRR